MKHEDKEDKRKDPSDMTWKEKGLYYLKQCSFSILFGMVIMGIGIIIAYLISNHYTYGLQDTMFYEGALILFIGIFASMKGSPSASGIQGAGMKDAYQRFYYANMEAEGLNMEGKDSSKEFRNRSIVVMSRSAWNLIFGGLILTIVSQVFF